MSTPRTDRPGIRGRGTPERPPSRFDRLCVEPLADGGDRAEIGRQGPATQLLRDASRGVLARNASPDVGFDVSLNPYRGCEHGCVYCYARPTHEYLGFSAGLDFETRILVKPNAPELLRAALRSPRWRPQVIALSGVTDAYQPAERRLGLTRGCLEVLAGFRNPVCVTTKSRLVVRDLDLLQRLAAHGAVTVTLSVTSLDGSLQRALEPRASRPRSRLEAIEHLAKDGIPVGVNVAPVIPGLTEHELPAILAAAARAGARHAGFQVLRLPHGVAALFDAWLARHRPEARHKVLARIRALRGGSLDDARFGWRHRGSGLFARQIESLFALGCRRAGLDRRPPALSARAFRRPGESRQLALPL